MVRSFGVIGSLEPIGSFEAIQSSDLVGSFEALRSLKLIGSFSERVNTTFFAVNYKNTQLIFRCKATLMSTF